MAENHVIAEAVVVLVMMLIVGGAGWLMERDP